MPIREQPLHGSQRGLFAVKRTAHHPNMLPLVNTLLDLTKVEEIWSTPGHLSTKGPIPDGQPVATVHFLLSYSHMEKDMDKFLLYVIAHSAKPNLPFRIQVAKHLIPWETLSLYTLSIQPANRQNKPRKERKITDEGTRHVHRLLRKAMKPGIINLFWKKEVNTQRARHRKSGKILLPDLNNL
jgi:hypothetical protein